jgi:hypothetical protein
MKTYRIMVPSLRDALGALESFLAAGQQALAAPLRRSIVEARTTVVQTSAVAAAASISCVGWGNDERDFRERVAS